MASTSTPAVLTALTVEEMVRTSGGAPTTASIATTGWLNTFARWIAGNGDGEEGYWEPFPKEPMIQQPY